MAINYASIIEKADLRRKALQDVEALLETLDEQVNVLRDATIYAGMLGKAWGALDMEGRALLSSGVRQLLGQPKTDYLRNVLETYAAALETK